MLVEEYNNASRHQEQGREYIIVRVKDHKTGTTERAKVTIHGDMLALVEEWQKVRDATVPTSPLFFPNLKGGKLDHLYRHVNTVASRYGINLPQMQTVRSVVEVKATCLPAAQKAAIARTLSHSSTTAEKHYCALETSKSVMGYKSVGEILRDPVEDGPSTSASTVPHSPQRRRFTAAQNAMIVAEFGTCIDAKVPPDKKQTEAFLEKHGHHFPGRVPHDIYDRVRNIIGRKNLKKAS